MVSGFAQLVAAVRSWNLENVLAFLYSSDNINFLNPPVPLKEEENVRTSSHLGRNGRFHNRRDHCGYP